MVVLWVKKEDPSPRMDQTEGVPVAQSLPVQQEVGATAGEEGGKGRSRREAFDSNKSKSISMDSLKNTLKSPFRLKSGKTYCGGCKKKCSGEVLRVGSLYYHAACFRCHDCTTSLSKGGFFTKDSRYYCTKCYQTTFGTRCAKCGMFVEGEVVSALGNTFHQACFTCARCRRPFPTGERVTFTGKSCLCQGCIQGDREDGGGEDGGMPPAIGEDACAGCGQQLREAQALVALDKQYHIWCFKCTACSVLLHGEYMGHEGRPYCERDYHEQFGVRCAYCHRFISGKVLQAGDNNHFHPTCARCTKCGDPFGDGEEMYLQGAAIWHPRCGPGPGESGFVINGFGGGGGCDTSSVADYGLDGLSSTMSELHYGSRASSPGSGLRDYRSQSPATPNCYSYIRQGRSLSSLRRPIDPYDRKTSHPPMHFHVPAVGSRKVSTVSGRSSSRSGMRAMVDNLVAESPRPRSPHMNNEEPIEMSHYPDGRKEEERKAPIERDDFPAPPFLYADEARKRRWSEPMRKEESVDVEMPQTDELDRKLTRQEESLRKISEGSSIGKVFLNTVRQREKINAQRRAFIDPRSYARTASATREPQYRLRFDSPVNASPSRLTHSACSGRPEDEPQTFFRSSSGRSLGTPGYHTPLGRATPSGRMASSIGGPPKPGYTGRKSSTLPSPGAPGSLSPSGYAAFETGLGEKTYSTEFSSRSDLSEKSYNGCGPGPAVTSTVQRRDLRPSTTYTQGLRHISTAEPSGRSYPAHMNRSLPNMASMTKAPKIYPIHLLMTSNYRLPNDADRCALERHLSDADFQLVFEVSRPEFYRLPQWKRNDLKKRVKLF